MQDRIAQLQSWRDAQFAHPVSEPKQEVRPDPAEQEEQYIAHKVRKSPERILDLISDKKARFTRNDIARGLAKYVPHAQDRQAALSSVLRSDKLARVDDGKTPVFTTQEMLELENRLSGLATKMAKTKAFGVWPDHLKSAFQHQNKALHKAVGANLSEELRRAITHVVNRRQLSAVIGLAGAGKAPYSMPLVRHGKCKAIASLALPWLARRQMDYKTPPASRAEHWRHMS